MLREQHRFFRSILVACDTAIIASVDVVAFQVRFHWMADSFPPVRETVQFSTHAIPPLVVTPIVLIAMLWAGLYMPRRDQRFYREAGSIIRAVLVGTLVTFAGISFFRNVLFNGIDPSRAQYGVFLLLCIAALMFWRLSFRLILRRLRERGWNLRHVAIIGTGRLGQVVCHTLRRNSWTGITPGYFISHRKSARRTSCLNLPVLGGLDNLERALREHNVTGVIIAMPGRLISELPDLMARLERFPVDLRIVPDMNPRFMPINMTVNELEGMPILSVRESPLSGWGRVAKRSVDVLGGLAAMFMFAIPMMIIAIAIRVSSDGPVIYRQERMGLNGRRFRIYKFRTMRSDKSSDSPAPDDGELGWTARDDPRITSVGRFLRRTSLDELPQLFNVLPGEMSLVGPRPERPELIARFREDWRGYMLRQNVKAGMTGWAQVNGLRGDTSLRKRLQYDMFYIRNWSIWFDFRILWMTIFKGFAHPNAH